MLYVRDGHTRRRTDLPTRRRGILVLRVHLGQAVLDATGIRALLVADVLRRALEVHGVYGAGASELLAVARETPTRCRTLLLIGHSPGVQDVTLALTQDTAADDALTRARDKFPTAAIAVLALPGPWQRLAPGSGLLIAFATPRDRGN